MSQGGETSKTKHSESMASIPKLGTAKISTNTMCTTCTPWCKCNQPVPTCWKSVSDLMSFPDQTSLASRSTGIIGWETTGPLWNTWSCQWMAFTAITYSDCHSWAVTFAVSTETQSVNKDLICVPDGINLEACIHSQEITTRMTPLPKNPMCSTPLIMPRSPVWSLTPTSWGLLWETDMPSLGTTTPDSTRCNTLEGPSSNPSSLSSPTTPKHIRTSKSTSCLEMPWRLQSRWPPLMKQTPPTSLRPPITSLKEPGAKCFLS